ncbi:Phage integrase family protein [Aureliella helgolandensis]|uniref:Phage integrase family protein n=1 Tax=Aureliella helgolandensis TaxID=2527968 RepID=A0A518GCL7_9BACT|nr:Phage integrase family protein [Aureliella helgolandensis]
MKARHAKNGKQAKQYVSSDLHGRLRDALPLHIPERSAELLREDLAIARAAWLATKPSKPSPDFLSPLNQAGESLDFHALRHTCGAWLAIAGVNVKVIQSIMRHSSITLTLDTYGHLLPGAEQDAAKQLSVLLSQASA